VTFGASLPNRTLCRRTTLHSTDDVIPVKHVAASTTYNGSNRRSFANKSRDVKLSQTARGSC